MVYTVDRSEGLENKWVGRRTEHKPDGLKLAICKVVECDDSSRLKSSYDVGTAQKTLKNAFTT